MLLHLVETLEQWFLTFFDVVPQCSFTKIIRANQLHIYRCVFSKILETVVGTLRANAPDFSPAT